MKPVRCSWVDMQKRKAQLSANERGDQKALERMLCVDKSTVSYWQNAIYGMEAIEGKVEIFQLSHCQPSHLSLIARHFRKRSKCWTEDIKDEIAEWVDRCEAEEWTVQELRLELRDSLPAAPAKEKPFDWLAEIEAIYHWLAARQQNLPPTLRPGFPDLVRRALDRLEIDHAGGRERDGSAPPGENLSDTG